MTSPQGQNPGSPFRKPTPPSQVPKERTGIFQDQNPLRPESTDGELIMKEYKVLTQKDRFFGGKFDPEKLETAINSYAAEGWAVVSVTSASIPSLTGKREEMIIVMERANEGKR